ncbi:unnamed protein product [Bursaphelenchus okinawaensis]|uniref:Uncharacterized protein n=1 Tax=Bursaphelenchus okinawaensis TaxID=465554 RepID=A0A811LA00_9BILA|nr:unnamed protein product [Bursaphelenchus okinawaensis]CAG9119863.1 unnamed protein product [Bursaphelenchus okinawaensis]
MTSEMRRRGLQRSSEEEEVRDGRSASQLATNFQAHLSLPIQLSERCRRSGRTGSIDEATDKLGQFGLLLCPAFRCYGHQFCASCEK